MRQTIAILLIVHSVGYGQLTLEAAQQAAQPFHLSSLVITKSSSAMRGMVRLVSLQLMAVPQSLVMAMKGQCS